MINDLVDGKTIMVEDCHRLSSSNFTGYVIATTDTWENKYAKVIQEPFLYVDMIQIIQYVKIFLKDNTMNI